MLFTLLRVILVAALLVTLPGVLLVNALLPPGKARLRRSERALLAFAGGVFLMMLVGVVLGSLPHGDKGIFGPWTVAAGVVLASVALLVVGARRGAYPRLVARWPQLAGRAADPAQPGPAASTAAAPQSHTR